jgi:hypothetical protein
MRAKNEAKFLAEAYKTKLLLERVVDGTLMCPEACCGAPVMECKCGPDCPHCNCHEIQKLSKKEEDAEDIFPNSEYGRHLRREAERHEQEDTDRAFATPELKRKEARDQMWAKRKERWKAHKKKQARSEDNELHLRGTGWAAEPPPVDEEVRLGNTTNDRFKRLRP